MNMMMRNWIQRQTTTKITVATVSRIAVVVLALLHLFIANSWWDQDTNKDICAGYKVFIYDLPKPPFVNPATISWDIMDENADHSGVSVGRKQSGMALPASLGFPCAQEDANSFGCLALQDGGMGVPCNLTATYRDLSGIQPRASEQLSMHWVFQRFFMQHCQTKNSLEANLFFIPLPLYELKEGMRTLNKTIEEARSYMNLIQKYLASQPTWEKQKGRNHLLVVSRPSVEHKGSSATYDTGFDLNDSMWTNVNVFSIEAEKSGNVVGVPYPTFFRPQTEDEIHQWLDFVRHKKRTHASRGILAAGYRHSRKEAISKCQQASSLCTYHGGDASFDVPKLIPAYLEHTFSIQPAGDTPTRRAFFDSLICGTIPVVFHSDLVRTDLEAVTDQQMGYTYSNSYFQFFGKDPNWLSKVALIATDLDDALRLIDETTLEQIEELRDAINDMVPNLLYLDNRWKVSEQSSSIAATPNAVTTALQLLPKESSIHEMIIARGVAVTLTLLFLSTFRTKPKKTQLE